MQPAVILVVGYITGILWGKYLETSIAPVIFLLFLVVHLISKKSQKFNKYKLYIVFSLILAFISNIQIMHLENKFNTLYSEVQEVTVIRSYNKQSKRNTI